MGHRNLTNNESHVLRSLLTAKPSDLDPTDQILGLGILLGMQTDEYTPSAPNLWAMMLTTPTIFQSLQVLFRNLAQKDVDPKALDKAWYGYVHHVIEFATFRENLRKFGIPAVNHAAINLFMASLFAISGSLSWRYHRLAILCDSIGLGELLPVSYEKGTQILGKHWDVLAEDFVAEIEVYLWDETYGTLYVRNTLAIDSLPYDDLSHEIVEEEEDEFPF